MTQPADTTASTSGASPGDASRTAAVTPAIPEWYPAWARQLAGAYFAGSASVFVLHGNTFDDVRLDGGDAPAYGPAATFLAEQLFGSWDIVLHYDVGLGIRPFAGRAPQRLREMSPRTAEIFGTNLDKSRVVEPQAVFAALDRFLIQQLHSPADARRKVALVIDHASFAFPSAEPGSLSLSASSAAVSGELRWMDCV